MTANALVSLPDNLEIPRLRHLSLEANQLRDLPNNAPFLTGLTFLNLSHNHMRELPSALRQATALVDLALHHQVWLLGCCVDLQGVEVLTGLERLQRVTLWGGCQPERKSSLKRSERMAVRFLKSRKIIVE